jgi:hypothetical protein
MSLAFFGPYILPVLAVCALGYFAPHKPKPAHSPQKNEQQQQQQQSQDETPAKKTVAFKRSSSSSLSTQPSASRLHKSVSALTLAAATTDALRSKSDHYFIALGYSIMLVTLPINVVWLVLLSFCRSFFMQ